MSLTMMYLTGDTKLWWRTRSNQEANGGCGLIETWDALKKELKDQFLPCNSSWLARDALKKLQQTGSVRDYVREFSSIMLDIRNMSEEDKLHTFLTGLHNWARIELVRQGVQDFASARAAADRLLDL